MKPTVTTNVILALIAVLLILTTAFAAEVDVGGPPTFCEAKCGVRCSKAGRRDRCLKYCGICCEKCLCVPSGTYGNKDECPCYRDMKNSKGQPKCP